MQGSRRGASRKRRRAGKNRDREQTRLLCSHQHLLDKSPRLRGGVQPNHLTTRQHGKQDRRSEPSGPQPLPPCSRVPACLAVILPVDRPPTTPSFAGPRMRMPWANGKRSQGCKPSRYPECCTSRRGAPPRRTLKTIRNNLPTFNRPCHACVVAAWQVGSFKRSCPWLFCVRSAAAKSSVVCLDSVLAIVRGCRSLPAGSD